MQIALYATNGMNPATGYGKMELGLLRGMREAGLNVGPVFTEPFFADARLSDLALLVGNPEHYEDYPAARRLWNFSMAEADRINPFWVDALNAHYERVLVPCPGLVDVYQSSGVVIPVHYVPLGVDFSEIKYVERDPEPETFTWLTYSIGDMRKGAEIVMMAFTRLFKGDPRHRLIIKCRDEMQWLDGCMEPQIEVVAGELPEAEWHALMARANAFIFPSRGEGFGLPPREAVLSGLPTVATQHLGMWDVNKWGWPVEVQAMWPAQFDDWPSCANAEGSRWANPNWYHVDSQMYQIWRHYPAALERARNGREYLLKEFTWSRVGQKLAIMADRCEPVAT